MVEIRFRNIQKRFRDTVVVYDLNLLIRDSEFFTFVGPSGCGKSTILNLVAGLEPAGRGDILFGDVVVNDFPPGKRDVAMVFQSYALYPHMTVRDNIGFPLKVRRVRSEEIEREIGRMAALLDLEPLLDRVPSALSGGQRQRVALGRALIRRPKVFLMDEPLSNLDARLRIGMRAELKRLHQQFPVTTIYVTHDQEEAMALSDRVAVLHAGKIQQCGPPAEVYEKPSNLFVAQFIGNPPMNLIEESRLRKIPSLGPYLSRLKKGEVVAGIRPFDLPVGKDPSVDWVEGKLLLVERTGNDTWVDFLWEGVQVRGRADRDRTWTPGEPVYFQILPDRIHFFEKRNGGRLVPELSSSQK